MANVRQAPGGGRIVSVSASRLGRWMDGFDANHGVVSLVPTELGVVARAADGATATCTLPLGMLLPLPVPEVSDDDGWGPLLDHVVEAALCEWPVGVVYARKAAIAVGLFRGRRLLRSKVDTSYVQGRTAAGGWSQQRYQRRRGNQAKAAAGKGSDIVLRVLGENMRRLAVVVTAGDREAVSHVLEDPRLAPLAGLADYHFGDVGEPRLASLKALPDRFLAISIHVTDPV